ncbi:NACHT, LRR and PYD domains-containing protein 12-like [Alligator sinensis]|uniref:NACHT, LRR and PYD domains-containing protein 12-like n=1 Tax=Alligator sinensis TaxID=38654 RepID=A0A1U8DPP1_ALLSI|nr:NACHT, LRR and PYD domains-containing protein 12-like [Alligator sinensis]
MDEGEELAQTSTTVTGVYLLYLYNLLRDPRSKSKQLLQTNLKGLCSLAADGVCRQKILFEAEELKKHGLDTSDSLFLNENLFHKSTDCECLYSFIHLSFQEFFAALFYALEEEAAAVDKGSGNDIKALAALLANSGQEEFKREVREDPSLEGLRQMAQEQETEFTPDKREQVVWDKGLLYRLWVPKNHAETWEPQRQLINVTNYCKNCETCQRTGKSGDKRRAPLQPLPIIDQPFHRVAVDIVGPLKHRTRRGKKYILTLVDYATRLRRCRLTPACCGDLAAALSTSPSLTELDLGGNEDLGAGGVRLLCEGLRHPSCKLQTLRLWRCRLTPACCGDLAAALSTSPSLTELDLGGNEDLGAGGVRLLCEGLRHPSCKVQTLR